MLKRLTYLSVIFYLIVLHGQNFFEFGSDLRINFYFIGNSISMFLFSYILHKVYKNIATAYFLFMCIGAMFNEVFHSGELAYIDIIFGFVGVIYILLEKRLKPKLIKLQTLIKEWKLF